MGHLCSSSARDQKLIDAGKASLFIYSNGHGAGEVATQALYCAYEQDKFWEVHDIFMSGSGYDMINNTVKNDMSKSSQLVALVDKVLDGKKPNHAWTRYLC